MILVKRHLNTVRNCELRDPKVLIYRSFSPSNFVFFIDHQKLPRPRSSHHFAAEVRIILHLLQEYRPSGRPSSIPDWAIPPLKKRLAQPQGFGSYYEIQQWLADTLGVQVSYSAVYRLVRGHLKAKLKVAKRQSPDQDPEQLESFKAYLGTDLLLLNSFVSNSPDRSFNKIRFWCQDETRWCLTTICRRLITALGVKPVGSFQWQRNGYWLYGFVEPLTGDTFFYEFSHLDYLCFEECLALFSQAYPDDFHIIH